MNLLFLLSLVVEEYSTVLLKLAVIVLLWLVVIAACMVDLRTGIKASKRLGNFRTTSRGLRQTMKKVLEYISILIIALLLDIVLSYLSTLSDIFPLLGLFRVPLLTIGSVICFLIIEGISVRENINKCNDADMIPPELVNKALNLISALGDDKVKAIAELLKKT